MKTSDKPHSLAYDDQGSGPAVILLHGYPLCRAMWQPQLKVLSAAGYRVIAPDLRGFGQSPLPKGPVAMADYADDVIALMDDLGLGRAVVVAMSMGGYVLFNLTERYPKRLAGAVFSVTRAAADDEAGKLRRSALAREVAEGRPQVVVDAFKEILFAPQTLETDPELVVRVRGWLEATAPQGLIGGLLAMRDRPDATPLLPRIKVPTLVIGAELDRAIPPEHSRAIAAGIPAAHLTILPGVGHLANLEAPEAFNNLLLEFLASLCG
jgi:3-oxoadipate enol-lactonase